MNKTVIITEGFANRDNAAVQVVSEACRFRGSEIILEHENWSVNAKSLMGVMAFYSNFSPCNGLEVNVITKGDEEADALDAICGLLTC